MAEFSIEHSEGMHWVKVVLKDDAIRAERGALNRYVGNIRMETPLPSPRDLWVSLFSTESPLRPRYRGTGEVYLDPSLGGFHIMEMNEDEGWIVENGAYWASDDEIKIAVRRERLMTAFWAGEGLLWYHSRLKGKGKVVLVAHGPVQEIQLNDETLVVDGRAVIARTEGIRFSVRRPTKSLISYWLSGQRAAYVYRGTGRLLLSAIPYWRYAMNAQKAAEVKRLPSAAN